MQIETLQVLCDVARFRSFSQAGAANRITQSAVSQLISQLERKLGVQLVDRSVRPLRLTDQGRAFADGGQDIVSRYRELEESIRGATPDMPLTVHVAAIYSVGLRDMHQYIDAFASAEPSAHVRMEYLHPDKAYERVLSGAADLGIVSFPRRGRDLEVEAWREEEIVLVCPPQHPLAARPGVPPASLQGVDYVGFDRGLVFRREVDRFLREHDVTVTITMEFDNIETIKKAIVDGGGVALLPLPTLLPEVEAGTLVAIPLVGCRFLRPLGIIHRRHGLNAAARRFLKILQDLHHNGEKPVRKRRTQTAGAGR